MIKIAALWQKESQTGAIYYQGNLGEAKLLMYPSKSENPHAPAFTLHVAEPPARKPMTVAVDTQEPQETDESVPF